MLFFGKVLFSFEMLPNTPSKYHYKTINQAPHLHSLQKSIYLSQLPKISHSLQRNPPKLKNSPMAASSQKLSRNPPSLSLVLFSQKHHLPLAFSPSLCNQPPGTSHSPGNLLPHPLKTISNGLLSDHPPAALGTVSTTMQLAAF